jgi:hypothetical protein
MVNGGNRFTNGDQSLLHILPGSDQKSTTMRRLVMGAEMRLVCSGQGLASWVGAHVSRQQ